MTVKFQKIIDGFSKYNVVTGDDEQIHAVLEQVGIEVDELWDLAKYLENAFEKALDEGNPNIADKIEQLQYGINFLCEAHSEGYKVLFKSKYIEQSI
ncbi:hypothetical protein [Paenibacillus terrae]|uniref:Uncharacterized protein n=1 Tax=Paenibacillus terrae TaxID=159743 RepID=A0A0D7WUZ9_9BACL|nr:hypothetical protein [Paenibacillus terrae]KJD42799.1 hypothetical protein QD47_26260 [Paenibacillus terrae]